MRKLGGIRSPLFVQITEYSGVVWCYQNSFLEFYLESFLGLDTLPLVVGQ